MKEINLTANSFNNLRKGTRYNRAPAGVIIIFLSLFITQCKYNSTTINCDSINQQSMSFINKYYIDNNKQNLDSALFYVNKGIYNCHKYKNLFSIRKLAILSEKQDYDEAIQFIDTFKKVMFSDLPYYTKVLKLRFQIMKAINDNNIDDKEKYLTQCINIIDDFLKKENKKVKLLLEEPNIENILKNPLSTAITQYYYYKSIKFGNETIKKELENKNINDEFINYLINYLQTDIMEFNGI